jgi:hypothetical protein
LKLKSPTKSKKIVWVILNNRAPTWDILQKITVVGLGWCILCQKVEETNKHIIMTCPFTKEVLKGVERMIGYQNVWLGDDTEEAFS